MESLDLAGMLVTFLALLGPQKVLLSFARATGHQDARDSQRAAIAATCVAIFAGGLCAWTAPWGGAPHHGPLHGPPGRHRPAPHGTRREESLAPPRGA